MNCKLIIIVLLFPYVLFTQLADWKPFIGGTDFPTNISGQINGISRISQLKFHTSDTNKYYAVTSQGGLVTSNNQGQDWIFSQGTEGLVSNCASVCINYADDQTILLGTGDPNYYYNNGIGILKSTDGGATFTATSLTTVLVVEIIQNPNNQNEYVAATNSGIYKSFDGGLNWVLTTSALNFCDLKLNTAVNSTILYAVTKSNAPLYYRSTDFGSTWTQITAGIVQASNIVQAGARIAVTPADPDIVYLEIIGGGGIVHKSTDSGLSFSVVKPEGSPYLTFYSDTITSTGQGNYDNAITIDRQDPNKLWLQAHNTWYSADGGVTWVMLTQWASKVHTDMHQIQQAPFNKNKLYTCSDGGVWLSTDGGNNWTPKSNGIYGYEIGNSCGKSSLTRPNFVSIGTQDNGRLRADENGFVCTKGGDDYVKSQFDYNGNIYFDGLNRILNHTGNTVTYNLPTATWNAFGFNRTNANLGFMGEMDVYRTTNLNNATPTWEKISNFNLDISDVHSCIANPNKLYVLLTNGMVYVSNDAMSATPTFTPSSTTGTANSTGSIVAIANNENLVYLQKNSKVYYSNDGGVTWTNISYNLPNVNHRRILAELYGGTEELVFIATNNAVYYKKAGQTAWTIYNTQLPLRKSPTDFSMYDDGTKQSKIRYACFGRGIWESPFDNLRVLDAQILNTDSLITCSKPTVLFTDASIGEFNSPINYNWSFPGGIPATANTSSVDVSYPAEGTYTISLTVTDGFGNSSTKTISRYIQKIGCTPDTIPGRALQINGTSNYGETSVIPLGITNTITLSCWLKIDQDQVNGAGIIFSGNGGATGLNFKNGNQIGFHYNNSPSTYNYSGGPVIQKNVWTHIALVTTATTAMIYVNGVPYTKTGSYPIIDFSNPFFIGNDRNNLSRTMIGQLDEICFYNRSLSQNEIRELMHLTRNSGMVDIDPTLIAYYQANEYGQIDVNRVNTGTIILNGTATTVISTAPIGSGNSERTTINASGNQSFVNEGINSTFTTTPPNGEVCITRLNIQPDSLLIPYTFPNSSLKYWIVNNYGTNTTFGALSNMDFIGYGTITAADASAPRRYKLLERETGDYEANSWILVDSAFAVDASTGIISFPANNINTFNKQYTIVRSECFFSAVSTISIAQTTGSNPSCAGTSLTFTAIQTNGGTSPTYQWKVNGINVGTNNSSYTTSSLSNNDIVSCDLISNNPCANPSPTTSNTITMTISPVDTPTISIVQTTGSNPSCAGTPLTFTATQTNGGSSPSYQWKVNGINVGTNNSSYTTSSLSNNDIVSCDLTSNNPCANPMIISSMGVSLIINPIPDAPIISENGIILSSNYSIGNQWFYNGIEIVGALNQDYTILMNGTYTVTVTENGCTSNPSTVVIFNTLSVEESEIDENIFTVSPNPSNGKISFKYSNINQQKCSIILFDLRGETLYVEEINNEKGLFAKDFDFQFLSKGEYFIKVITNNNQLSKKIVIE